MTKLICFYLPQFHSFPENDLWWGKDFTEWTCVKNAKPKRNDHRIKKPHPDIGYYSLLDKKTRYKQGETAKKYLIDGFCYYHYWFGNKTLMDKPLKLMLKENSPDIPFCFSWANEPWTRRMNGGNGELLIAPTYDREEEWNRHLDYLIPFFKNKNYIKVFNAPMFVIYRPSQIPFVNERTAFYKERLRKEGFSGLHSVLTIGNFEDDFFKLKDSFDATLDFYPHFRRNDSSQILEDREDATFYDMKKVYQYIINKEPVFPTHYKGLMAGFDSSPRNPKRSNIYLNGNIRDYKRALSIQLASSDFVFINSWNEWGEGAALEPEEIDGYKYLEATKEVKERIKIC